MDSNVKNDFFDITQQQAMDNNNGANQNMSEDWFSTPKEEGISNLSGNTEEQLIGSGSVPISVEGAKDDEQTDKKESFMHETTDTKEEDEQQRSRKEKEEKKDVLSEPSMDDNFFSSRFDQGMRADDNSVMETENKIDEQQHMFSEEMNDPGLNSKLFDLLDTTTIENLQDVKQTEKDETNLLSQEPQEKFEATPVKMEDPIWTQGEDVEQTEKDEINLLSQKPLETIDPQENLKFEITPAKDDTICTQGEEEKKDVLCEPSMDDNFFSSPFDQGTRADDNSVMETGNKIDEQHFTSFEPTKELDPKLLDLHDTTTNENLQDVKQTEKDETNLLSQEPQEKFEATPVKMEDPIWTQGEEEKKEVLSEPSMDDNFFSSRFDQGMRADDNSVMETENKIDEQQYMFSEEMNDPGLNSKLFNLFGTTTIENLEDVKQTEKDETNLLSQEPQEKFEATPVKMEDPIWTQGEEEKKEVLSEPSMDDNFFSSRFDQGMRADDNSVMETENKIDEQQYMFSEEMNDPGLNSKLFNLFGTTTIENLEDVKQTEKDETNLLSQEPQEKFEATPVKMEDPIWTQVEDVEQTEKDEINLLSQKPLETIDAMLEDPVGKQEKEPLENSKYEETSTKEQDPMCEQEKEEKKEVFFKQSIENNFSSSFEQGMRPDDNSVMATGNKINVQEPLFSDDPELDAKLFNLLGTTNNENTQNFGQTNKKEVYSSQDLGENFNLETTPAKDDPIWTQGEDYETSAIKKEDPLWKQEKEKFLNASLEERRMKKKCTELASIKTWPQYYNRKINKGFSDAEAEFPEISKKVSIWRGDITSLLIDAIVNAANEKLLGGGGVDKAIHEAAGSLLRDECSTFGGASAGESVITGGYNLPAKYVIHTVGPRGERPGKLRDCYLSSLQYLIEENQKTIAFPCVSTGIFGYPNDKAAEVVLKTVRGWLEKNHAKVDRVIFCLFLEKDVNCYEEKLQKYFPMKDDHIETKDAKKGFVSTEVEVIIQPRNTKEIYLPPGMIDETLKDDSASEDGDKQLLHPRKNSSTEWGSKENVALKRPSETVENEPEDKRGCPIVIERHNNDTNEFGGENISLIPSDQPKSGCCPTCCIL